MAVESQPTKRKSPERGINRWLALSPYTAARILTNKLDLRQELTPDELQPGRIPETSTLLRDKAHESWLNARQQADQERATREYHVNGQTKRYQEMGLTERVEVWAEDVVEIVQGELHQDPMTWMTGFAALGFNQGPDNSPSQAVSRLHNFFATDFYTRYCMFSPEQSAEAIARSMVRYFIGQKPQEQHEQGVEALLHTWETMQPLFGQMLDEITRQDVEFILQAQAQRALGNITPEVASQTPSPEDVPVLVVLHRQFVSQEDEEQVRKRILQYAQPQPAVSLESSDELTEAISEPVREEDEEGAQKEQTGTGEQNGSDGGRASRRRRAVPVGGQTASSEESVHAGGRTGRGPSIRSLLPPQPRSRAEIAGPVIVPVLSSAATVIVPILEPAPPVEPTVSASKVIQGVGEVEGDKATQLLVVYMRARTAAYVLEAELFYLRNRAMHVSKEERERIWSQHKKAFERGPRTILTEDELKIPAVVDAILGKYSTGTILHKPFSVAHEVTQEWLTRHHDDSGKSTQSEFQERANLAFAELPRELERLTKVRLRWGDVSLVRTLFNKLLWEGHKATHRNEITEERVQYSKEELAAQADYLAQVPVGELAYYIAELFGLDLMSS